MRAPDRPAVSIASSRWQAVTPEPHISHLLRIAVADHALQFGAQRLWVAQVAIEYVQANGRLTAPGTWPATGSSGSTSPRKRSPARASTNQPGACFSRALISSALAIWVVSKRPG